MGVDARMFFTLPAPLTERELLRVAFELSEAFYREPFWIHRKPSYGTPPHHAISTPDDDEEVGLTGNVYRVNLSGRYYGPGYERGPIYLFVAIDQWIEYRLPGASVFYGGDSDDVLTLFNEAARASSMRHFARHGHRPYHRDTQNEWDPRKSFCEFCQEPMTRYGHGAAWASWTCDGCGMHLERRDGKWARTMEKHGAFEPFKDDPTLWPTTAQEPR